MLVLQDVSLNPGLVSSARDLLDGLGVASAASLWGQSLVELCAPRMLALAELAAGVLRDADEPTGLPTSSYRPSPEQLAVVAGILLRLGMTASQACVLQNLLDDLAVSYRYLSAHDLFLQRLHAQIRHVEQRERGTGA